MSTDRRSRRWAQYQPPNKGDSPGTTDEPHTEDVPELQGIIARLLAQQLMQVIAPEHLSFGGGTVLAARWQHRESLDVDLFCQPDAYAQLGRNGRAQIETLIKEIAGCNTELTWCEDIATYTEIDGIEATILPRPTTIRPTTTTTLAGTHLRLQSTEEIIYAKIVRRMYDAGEITVRDAYDVACAKQVDPKALQRTLGHIDKRIIEFVSETTKALPEGWSEHDEKQLIKPAYVWNEQTLKTKLIAALQSEERTQTKTSSEPEP